MASRWTLEQMATLQRMRDVEGAEFDAIAAAVGHSAASCQTQLSKIKTARINPEKREQTAELRRLWTDEEIAQLLDLKDVKHLSWSGIDAMLRRGQGSSAHKYHSLKRAQARAAVDAAPRRRPTYVEHATLTAAFCGDPLPGRSALDKLRRGDVDPPASQRGVYVPAPITLAGGVQ